MNATTDVVFLTGTLCTCEVFSKPIAALEQQGLQCHKIDFGTADSTSAMAAKALASTGDKPFAIVAFSMGGMVAFELLRTVPHLVQSVVLISSNAHADLPGRAELRQAHLEQAKDTGLAALISETYMPNYLYFQHPIDQQLIERMALDLGVDVFEAQLAVLANRSDSTGTLTEMNCPALILAGQQDPLCPPAEQRRMHSLARNSELVMLDNCGHFAPLEQPRMVSQKLVNWFTQENNNG